LERCNYYKVINKYRVAGMEVDEMESGLVAGADGDVVVRDSDITEGKATIRCGQGQKTFYNPAQEVNRDVSVIGIQTFIERELSGSGKVNILEAMAASGIRSIRYAKEIDNVDSILANDFSQQAVESLKENCKLNGTSKVLSSYEDASLLMFNKRNTFSVADLDPYGSPMPFLESILQCVKDGGMLLVTATDMAVLAGGNTPESCFAKYGSMSVKSKACQELALRILIHAVQSVANRYGKFVVPLVSLKIDFYVRIFFRVLHSPILCKQSAIQTAMFYQCTGCHSLSFQPLAAKKGSNHFVCPRGPPVGQRCNICESSFNFGGPIWNGPIHDKNFVEHMQQNVSSAKYNYLGTRRRLEGLLQVVQEETEDPLLYDISQLSSVLRSTVIPILTFRSAILNLGYKVSSSHTGPGTFKTNAPNEVIWQIFWSWHQQGHGSQLKSGTPGLNVLNYFAKNEPPVKVSFEKHPDANPASRQMGALRYQINPTKNWGPGVRNAFDANEVSQAKSKVEVPARNNPNVNSSLQNPIIPPKKPKHSDEAQDVT
ncbi:unnamed protein product, partial [Allacma fusca]